MNFATAGPALNGRSLCNVRRDLAAFTHFESELARGISVRVLVEGNRGEVVDVFISYPRAESQIPTLVKEHLEALGLRVFFDSSTLDSGSAFADEIDRALKTASVIVACWSPAAFRSDWVMKECAIGLQRKVLAPIAIKQLNPLDARVDFHGVNCLDLTDYDGGVLHLGFQRLVESIADIKGDVGLRHRLLAAAESADAEIEADRLAESLSPADLRKYAWDLWQDGAAPRRTHKRARILFEKAAQRGDPSAMVTLGAMLERGQVGEANDAAARDLYRQAAERGHLGAMGNFSYVLREGIGGPKDPAGSFRWLRQAAEVGGPGEMYGYSEALRTGLGGQVEPAPKAALDWCERAARAGWPAAMYRLGRMIEDGDAGPKDLAAARSWYQRGAEAGDAWAAYSLAVQLHHGKGCAIDLFAARDWYEKASIGGCAPAMSNYGTMLIAGEGGPEDKCAAREWYIRSAEAGHPMGMYNAAYVLSEGKGGPADKGTARRYYEAAAATGNLHAKYGLGILTWNAGDHAGGRRLWEEAAAKGHEPSRQQLLKIERDI